RRGVLSGRARGASRAGGACRTRGTGRTSRTGGPCRTRRTGRTSRTGGACLTGRAGRAGRACRPSRTSRTRRAGRSRCPCWPARTGRTSQATREVHLFLVARTFGSGTTLDVVTRIRVAGELNAEDPTRVRPLGAGESRRHEKGQEQSARNNE